MGKNIVVITILLFTSNAFGIALFSDLFEGFQKSAEYKSELPCESTTKLGCDAAAGPLGKALDTASNMGMNINKILINSSNIVFVETEKSGTCYVGTNTEDETAIKFTCSNKILINNKLQSIDRVVVLKKESNEQFVLEDITQKQNITR